jgi:hypothetical protein
VKPFPPYVFLENLKNKCELYLTEIKGDIAIYYRIAGCWGIRAKWDNSCLVTLNWKEHPQLSGKVLTECTRKEWLEGNRGYVSPQSRSPFDKRKRNGTTLDNSKKSK